MNDRLKYLGWRAEKQQETKRLKLKMQGLRDSLRDFLSPFEDVSHLKAEIIASQAIELAAAQTVYKGLLEQIEEVDRAEGYKE
jgi:hypothetical protein